MRQLGAVLLQTRNPADAELWARKAVETSRRVFGEEHALTLKAKETLALHFRLLEDHAATEALFRELLAISQRKFGEEHPDTLTHRGKLAWTLAAQGKVSDAEPELRTVLRLRRKVQGDRHHHTLLTMCALAIVLQSKAAAQAEAEQLAGEALRNGEQVLGDSHWVTLMAKNQLAIVWQQQGKLAEAEKLYREIVAVRLKKQPHLHPTLLSVLGRLSSLLEDKGEPDQAEATLRDALKVSGTLSTPDADRGPVLMVLGELRRNRGDPEGAEAFFREAVAVRRAERRPDDGGLATAIARLADHLVEQKKYVQAEPLLRKWLEVNAKTNRLGSMSSRVESLLGAVLVAQQNYVEAEPLLLRACEGLKQREPTLRISPYERTRQWLHEALGWLVQLYDARGKPDEAARWRKELETRTK
jgi:tetratricopeptide (TPR) repeat protein